MSGLRYAAYAAIAVGCVAIGIASAGIIFANSNTSTTMQFQRSPEPAPNVDVVTQAAEETSAAEALDEAPEAAAGFQAYQDANGNFVAPPPGAPQPAPKATAGIGPRGEIRNAVPGGGVGLDVSGFRMAQEARVNDAGEVEVTCEQHLDEPCGDSHENAEE